MRSRNMEKLEVKIDNIAADVSEIKVILAEQGVILAEHQRRSLANEASVELLRSQIKPIEHHIALWSGIGKTLMALITITGVIATVFKIIHP